jgi:hypothetical protein
VPRPERIEVLMVEKQCLATIRTLGCLPPANCCGSAFFGQSFQLSDGVHGRNHPEYTRAATHEAQGYRSGQRL